MKKIINKNATLFGALFYTFNHIGLLKNKIVAYIKYLDRSGFFKRESFFYRIIEIPGHSVAMMRII